jgi:amino acid transporter
MSLTVTFYGYTTFLTGWWDVGTFFSYYLMVGVCPILYLGWKLFKRSKLVKSSEAGMYWLYNVLCHWNMGALTGRLDLVWERPTIDAYEEVVKETHMTFWQEVGQMSGLGKKKTEHIA